MILKARRILKSPEHLLLVHSGQLECHWNARLTLNPQSLSGFAVGAEIPVAGCHWDSHEDPIGQAACIFWTAGQNLAGQL